MTESLRRYLVTGAAGAIGSAVARRLVADGAKVAVTDLRCGELDPSLSDTVAIDCDLATDGAVESLLSEAERKLGPLDGLVHCAAIGQQVPLLDCTLDIWNEILTVNLTATFELCQSLARRMAGRDGGVLVALASAAGIRPNAGNVPYGSSKAGVIGLMRSMAIDLAAYGVRANVLIPGPTESPLMRRIAGAAVPLLEARTMLKRLGQPDEIAAAASFLLSDEARYMTGSVLLADGGFANSGTDFRQAFL